MSSHVILCVRGVFDCSIHIYTICIVCLIIGFTLYIHSIYLYIFIFYLYMHVYAWKFISFISTIASQEHFLRM